MSERFLAQLEAGDGNISLRRFADVARALGTTPSALLAPAEAAGEARPIALLGVRGAGKSAVGAALAKELGARFVEVDREIAAAAGLPLAQLFALHGEAYYRRVEREVLARLLADARAHGLVIATGGSIVNDRAQLRAPARALHDHLAARARRGPLEPRRRAGRPRPMAENPHAFEELRALLAAREKLYARAEHAIDTSRRTLRQVVAAVAAVASA